LQRLSEGTYVSSIDGPERRAFNILFRKLFGEKDVDLRTARKRLSGVRLDDGKHKATHRDCQKEEGAIK
jgi:hypothetical protein